MNYFHGCKKRKNYFEGWYFKHQDSENVVVFIPGISINQYGSKVGFIQIISNTSSHFISYPYNKCYFDKKKLYIKIGPNIFTEHGIKVDICRKDIRIRGNVYYSRFLTIAYDIMGPFRLLPFMECNHRIYSLSHRVFGNLSINGEDINFLNGTGYIESDWGTSFPVRYLWSQCNYFEKKNHTTFLSIATIPMLGTYFTGCIGIIPYKNKQLRFASYLGAKVIYYNREGCCIKQGNYRLLVRISSNESKKLIAPKYGDMSRNIEESIQCTSNYQLYKHNKLLLELESLNGSMEYVTNTVVKQ